MEIYTLTTLYIIVMELFLTLILLRILKKYTPNITTKASLIFFGWFFTTLLLLNVIKIIPHDISSFALFSLVLLGVGLSGIFFYLLKEAFLALPQELLLMPQAFRMFFGAGFIVEAVYGIMPKTYGVVDGIMHITTAFLALTLAIWIARGCKCTRSLILVNLFGLLDIVIVAYGISFFILQEIGTEHNVFLAVFYVAPIFIWLHLISLYKVWLDTKSQN